MAPHHEEPSVRREQIERALREPRRLVETVHQRLGELVDVEDVGHGAPEREDRALELEALVKEDLRDPLLDLRANGVEEDQHDECADDDMKEELLAGDEPHQPQHERENEGERRQHAQASSELVEVDEAVVRDRLRQRVEENEDENRANRRNVDPGVGQVLDDGEETAEAADQGDVSEPRAFDARVGLEAASIERTERQGQEHGHVEEQPADDDRMVVVTA